MPASSTPRSTLPRNKSGRHNWYALAAAPTACRDSPADLPSPLAQGHHFDAVAWSRARRWLLAAFIGRGRGLWNIDHPVVHEAVVAQLLPDYKSAIPWLQRLCAYMWTQPAGRRKAEELPTALMQLTKHAERLEVIREAREESRLARTSSYVGTRTRCAARPATLACGTCLSLRIGA